MRVVASIISTDRSESALPLIFWSMILQRFHLVAPPAGNPGPTTHVVLVFGLSYRGGLHGTIYNVFLTSLSLLWCTCGRYARL